MVSWRNQTLQFLCLFLCRLYLTEAGCTDYFKPENWNTINITIKNLTETIPLVDVPSFKDMMVCTLRNESKNGRDMDHILNDCFKKTDKYPECGEESLKTVSFYDFMCLVAKAAGLDTTNIPTCTHDVVVELYKHFNLSPTTTTTKPTTPPTTIKTTTQTTTKPTTSTIKPTTSKQTPPAAIISTMTAASTETSSPSASSPSRPPEKTSPTTIGPTATSESTDISVDTPQKIWEEKKDTIVYSLLGLSLVVNLVLVFFLALLFNRRRSNHGPLPVSAVPDALAEPEPAERGSGKRRKRSWGRTPCACGGPPRSGQDDAGTALSSAGHSAMPLAAQQLCTNSSARIIASSSESRALLFPAFMNGVVLENSQLNQVQVFDETQNPEPESKNMDLSSSDV